MYKNEIIFLKPLENFFSPDNLGRIEREFFNRFLDDNGDLSPGSIVGKDFAYEGSQTFYLKDDIVEQFEITYLQALESFEESYVQASDARKIKMQEYVEGSLKFILSKNENFLKTYPEINGKLLGIKPYFSSRFGILLRLKGITKKEFDTDFKIKEIVHYKHLKQIYLMCIDNEILDDDEVSEKQFVEVLTLQNTKSSITFNCSTPLAIGFLKAISVFYKRFTAVKIARTGKFFTKSGVPITENNYRASNSRISPMQKLIICKFSEYIDNQIINR